MRGATSIVVVVLLLVTAAPAAGEPRLYTLAGSASERIVFPFDAETASERDTDTTRVTALRDGGLLVADIDELLRIDPRGRVASVRGLRFVEITEAAEGPDGSIVVAGFDEGSRGDIVRVPVGGRPVSLLPRRAPLARYMEPGGIAVMPDGAVLVADSFNDRIVRLAPDGTLTVASRMAAPTDVAAMPDGSYVVAQGLDRRRIRRVDPSGAVATLAGGGRGRLVGCREMAARSVDLDGFLRLAVGPSGLVLGTTAGVLSLDGDVLRPSLPCSGSADAGARRYPDGRPVDGTLLRDAADVAVGPGGELYAVVGDRLAAVLDDGGARFAAALTPATLRSARLGAAEVVTTAPAHVTVELRRRGRLVSRVSADVPAGSSTITLPPAQPGVFELRLRAVTADARLATHRLRVYAAAHLPTTLAKRILRRVAVFESEWAYTTLVDRCRRSSARRVSCRTREQYSGSSRPERRSARRTVRLRHDGVIVIGYRDPYSGRRHSLAAEP